MEGGEGMVVEIHLGGGQDPLNEDRPNYSRRAIDGLEFSQHLFQWGGSRWEVIQNSPGSVGLD